MEMFVNYGGLKAESYRYYYRKLGLSVNARGHFTTESLDALNRLPHDGNGATVRRLLFGHAAEVRERSQRKARGKKMYLTKGYFYEGEAPTKFQFWSEPGPRKSRAAKPTGPGLFDFEPTSAAAAFDAVLATVQSSKLPKIHSPSPTAGNKPGPGNSGSF